MNKFMNAAISEAKKAQLESEVPVGAVIVFNGVIISGAHNLKETRKDPTAHAEIIAIREAAKHVGDWRLDNCDMYVTLEPCPMCASAISQSRIRRLYFGSYDSKCGAAGSCYNLIDNSCEIYGGICEDECNSIIHDFFEKARN